MSLPVGSTGVYGAISQNWGRPRDSEHVTAPVTVSGLQEARLRTERRSVPKTRVSENAGQTFAHDSLYRPGMVTAESRPVSFATSSYLTKMVS